MKLDYVPLLKVQRELHDVPRGRERFEQYLRTIISQTEALTLDLPSLLIMNPMGREHVSALLDDYLALDAEKIAVDTVARASEELAKEPGDFKVTMIMADDLKGGWTNRYDYEFTWRLRAGPPPADQLQLPRWVKHFWINALLWTSEPASEQAVRQAILTAIYRAAFVQKHGPARTLAEMMKQEGAVMLRAGCTGPALEEDDIAYTREVLEPFLTAEDKRTCMECLFGDEPGKTLGFTPRGLSPWAGLALALRDARAEAELRSKGQEAGPIQ
jgi:hypothetical protein